jgi:hypothetical protein
MTSGLAGPGGLVAPAGLRDLLGESTTPIQGMNERMFACAEILGYFAPRLR